MIDAEVEAWRRQWQSGYEPNRHDWARSLKDRVERQSNRIRFGLAAPILVTVLVGGGVLVRALGTRQSMDIVIAVEAWLFILVTWAGSLLLARGTWRPFAETTAAFVDLSIRRCRANLRAVPFAIGLYVCQLVIVVLLKSRYSSGLGAVLTAPPTIVLGGVGLPALLLGGFWYARTQRAEIEHLLELERQLAAE